MGLSRTISSIVSTNSLQRAMLVRKSQKRPPLFELWWMQSGIFACREVGVQRVNEQSNRFQKATMQYAIESPKNLKSVFYCKPINNKVFTF